MLAKFCGAHSQHEVPGTCDRRSPWHMRSAKCLAHAIPIVPVQYRLCPISPRGGCGGAGGMRRRILAFLLRFFLNAWSRLAILLAGGVSEGGSAAPIRVRVAPHKACTASHPDRAYPHPPQPFSSIDKSADPTSPSPLMSALASGDPQAPSSAARSRLLTAPSPLRSLPEDGTRIA